MRFADIFHDCMSSQKIRELQLSRRDITALYRKLEFFFLLPKVTFRTKGTITFVKVKKEYYAWQACQMALPFSTTLFKFSKSDKSQEPRSKSAVRFVLKHTKDKNGSKGPAFLWPNFCQNHLGHQNRLSEKSRSWTGTFWRPFQRGSIPSRSRKALHKMILIQL